MAVIESPYSSKIIVKLNAGVNPSTGGVIVKNCPFPGVVKNADKEKVMDIVGALLPTLNHSLAGVRRIEETTLES